MRFSAVRRMPVLALALTLLALTALGSATFTRRASASDNTAKTVFELDAQAPYRFEVLCGSDVLLISWRTAAETSVDVFKVHRQALDDPEVAGWVNTVPLVAKGDNSSYSVIDIGVMDGHLYSYTLCGFVASDDYEEPVYLLSEALPLQLEEAIGPTCIFLPVVGN